MRPKAAAHRGLYQLHHRLQRTLPRREWRPKCVGLSGGRLARWEAVQVLLRRRSLREPRGPRAAQTRNMNTDGLQIQLHNYRKCQIFVMAVADYAQNLSHDYFKAALINYKWIR